MNKPGFLLYRCRACGQVFNSRIHVPDLDTVIISYINGKRLRDLYPNDIPLTETYLHFGCSHDFGVGDLAGGKYGEELS